MEWESLIRQLRNVNISNIGFCSYFLPLLNPMIFVGWSINNNCPMKTILIIIHVADARKIDEE